jgi:hypothetical protein
MLSLDDRERLAEIQDQLLRLYVLRRYAAEDGDLRQLRAIDREIAPLELERQSLRRWDTIGTA